MKGAGVAIIGLGEGEDEDKVEEVAGAINSPLIDVDINGASVLIAVTGGEHSCSEAEKVARNHPIQAQSERQDNLGGVHRPCPGEQDEGNGGRDWLKSKYVLGHKENQAQKAMGVDFIK